MGSIEKKYCDCCAAAMDAVEYSARLVEHPQLSTVAETLSVELCPSCYSAILGWLRDRKNVAAVQWAPQIPEVNPVQPPVIPVSKKK